MRHLILRLMLLSALAFAAPPAWAVPDVIVLHILDDVHPAGLNDYRTNTATHPRTTFQPATPSLDFMADNGIRLNSMYAQSVCSPGRSEIFGFGAVGTTDNLIGRVQSGQIPAQWSINLPVGSASIISTFHDLGYQVAGFGKLHLGTEQVANNPGGPTFAKQLGFDVYEAGVQSNDGLFGACATGIRTNALEVACAGHNYWCNYSLDGTVTIEGDGTSTAGASNDFVDTVIYEKAADYISNTALVSGKHLIIIGWHSPHSGWEDGTGVPKCDYNDDGIADQAKDDRVPGGTAIVGEVGTMPIYKEQLEYVDGRIGLINGLLDLSGDPASSDPNHLSVVVSDNGVANGGAGQECLASRGRKSTPYPCGVNVPFAIQGDDVSETNAEINALFSGVDIPETLAQLAGGSHPRRGGVSFADCITNSNGKTAANCTGRDVVVSMSWSKLGGEDDTDGTAIGTNPWPPRMGDTAAEWDEFEVGAVTDLCNGTWMLERIYNTAAQLGAFCERLFEITAPDPYLATTTAPIAATGGNTSSTCSSYGGALSTSGLLANQVCAYGVLSKEMNKRRNRIDERPSFTGSM